MVTNNAANNKTGASGTVLQGQGVGTASDFSTATFPSTATSTGTILRADGTNWVATTATYPATTTSQQILYSTAANVVGQLTTANSALAATNSSGTLAMRALSVVKQFFTTTGTYTPTAGMLYCVVQIVGGGGGGGGASTTTGAQCSSGAGGGAGEYAEGVFSAATVGASQAVTIGAAGAANSGAAGGNGGTTSLGALITAGGGIGGGVGTTGASSRQASPLGGSGGSGGTFRSQGQPGGAALSIVTPAVCISGMGGTSLFGSGGAPADFNVAAAAGLGNGSGGAGMTNFTSQSNASGGVGTKGAVLVTEYVIA